MPFGGFLHSTTEDRSSALANSSMCDWSIAKDAAAAGLPTVIGGATLSFGSTMRTLPSIVSESSSIATLSFSVAVRSLRVSDRNPGASRRRRDGWIQVAVYLPELRVSDALVRIRPACHGPR